MSDDFDGCECVWSHEFAMQRLINFIRRNQNACTDTQCFDDVSGRMQQQQATGSGDGGSFNITVMFMILALFMYILNPSTWGALTSRKQPSDRRDNNPDGSPPAPQPPPPAIN
ncbi:hypothetical protein KR018_003415 [Drosophila ironensis]|nr:hypothetical protein KR018_003415 [Drosophila ironensis]